MEDKEYWEIKSIQQSLRFEKIKLIFTFLSVFAVFIGLAIDRIVNLERQNEESKRRAIEFETNLHLAKTKRMVEIGEECERLINKSYTFIIKRESSANMLGLALDRLSERLSKLPDISALIVYEMPLSGVESEISNIQDAVLKNILLHRYEQLKKEGNTEPIKKISFKRLTKFLVDTASDIKKINNSKNKDFGDFKHDLIVDYNKHINGFYNDKEKTALTQDNISITEIENLLSDLSEYMNQERKIQLKEFELSIIKKNKEELLEFDSFIYSIKNYLKEISQNYFVKPAYYHLAEGVEIQTLMELKHEAPTPDFAIYFSEKLKNKWQQLASLTWGFANLDAPSIYDYAGKNQWNEYKDLANEFLKEMYKEISEYQNKPIEEKKSRNCS